MMPRLTIVVLLVGCAALPLGCKRKVAETAAARPEKPPAPVPTLGEITVQDLTPEEQRPGGATLDVEALTAAARKNLLEAGVFQRADAGAPVRARVRIDIVLEDVVAGDKAAARAAIRLRIDTRPSELAAPHWNEDVQAGAETIYRPATKPDKRDLFAKLAARTLSDLLGEYLQRQRLWTGDPAAAQAALKADAGEVRLEALRVVAERRLTGAVPELLALLEHPDEPVRDAALGALVALRERRAVGVLAAQRSMRDQREMRKILDAIAVLGGSEADEYLGFVAEGHEDAEIRTMAAEARERLRKRAAGEQK